MVSELVQWKYMVVEANDMFKSGMNRLMGGGINEFKTNEMNVLLNQYGTNGWELVNVMPTFTNGSTLGKIILYFKKPI